MGTVTLVTTGLSVILWLAAAFFAGYEIKLHLSRKQVYSTKRLHRRLLGSAILFIIGAMIFLGVNIIDLTADPWLFTIYWSICLLLTLSLVVIAIIDVRDILQGYVYSQKLLNDYLRQKDDKPS